MYCAAYTVKTHRASAVLWMYVSINQALQKAKRVISLLTSCGMGGKVHCVTVAGRAEISLWEQQVAQHLHCSEASRTELSHQTFSSSFLSSFCPFEWCPPPNRLHLFFPWCPSCSQHALVKPMEKLASSALLHLELYQDRGADQAQLLHVQGVLVQRTRGQ